MMRVLTALMGLALMLASCQAGQAASAKELVKGYATSKAIVENAASATKQPPMMEANVTAIACRTDLTRLSLRLCGLPHTSQRIDSATLTPFKGRTLQADDIDGVDFRRYFQWEDDGEINIEIDFPPLKKGAKRYTLTLVTPYGTYLYNISSK